MKLTLTIGKKLLKIIIKFFNIELEPWTNSELV